jgi:hypothetical protein
MRRSRRPGRAADPLFVSGEAQRTQPAARERRGCDGHHEQQRKRDLRAHGGGDLECLGAPPDDCASGREPERLDLLIGLNSCLPGTPIIDTNSVREATRPGRPFRAGTYLSI